MKKKLFIIYTIVLVLFTSLVTYLLVSKDNQYILKETSTKKGTFTNKLSMLLENESGDYVATTAESWPTTGYKLNSKLSKCENGGKVSWDFIAKRVQMEGTSSDKCYIYFDKMVTVDSYCEDGDNLADCIKTYGNQGYDISSIYIHDSSLINGAGDGSYRFAGASDYVNNYVCFGSDASTCPTDNLYRIIGVFGDQVKLIKYDYATSSLLGTDGAYSTNILSASDYPNYRGGLTSINNYYWTGSSNSSNVWSGSALNTTNLNGNYLTNIGTTWANKIASSSWQVGGNTWVNIEKAAMNNTYQNEITSPMESVTINSKIGLMYVSDYGYAASRNFWTYQSNCYDETSPDYRVASYYNWMYMGITEWTITNNYESYAFIIDNLGYISNAHVNSEWPPAVRPSFYLKSSVKYLSGAGTKESPIRLGNTITLANYVKSQYTGTQGSNGIYLHNGTIKSGDTVIDANDGSYRYAGANPNNYVCFGSTASTCPTDNLYRIIGVFGDNNHGVTGQSLVKLIKADYATSDLLGTDGGYTSDVYYASDFSNYVNKGGNLETLNKYDWNSNTYTNIWDESNLRGTNLYNNFISSIGTSWSNTIETVNWIVGGNTWANIAEVKMYQTYQNEIVNPSQTTKKYDKVGLMYVSDYGYAALPTYWTYLSMSWDGADHDYRSAINDNWMYMGIPEWTITPSMDKNNYPFIIEYQGHISNANVD